MNFSDLNFTDHSIKGATKASYIFENGWAISVVAAASYRNSGIKGIIGDDTFEVAFIRPNGDMLDILPWQTPVQITTLMHLIKML